MTNNWTDQLSLKFAIALKLELQLIFILPIISSTKNSFWLTWHPWSVYLQTQGSFSSIFSDMRERMLPNGSRHWGHVVTFGRHSEHTMWPRAHWNSGVFLFLPFYLTNLINGSASRNSKANWTFKYIFEIIFLNHIRHVYLRVCGGVLPGWTGFLGHIRLTIITIVLLFVFGWWGSVLFVRHFVRFLLGFGSRLDGGLSLRALFWHVEPLTRSFYSITHGAFHGETEILCNITSHSGLGGTTAH